MPSRALDAAGRRGALDAAGGRGASDAAGGRGASAAAGRRGAVDAAGGYSASVKRSERELDMQSKGLRSKRPSQTGR